MEKGGTVRAGDYIFVYRKKKESQQLGTGYFAYHRTVSAVKRVEFVNNRMSYIVLRGRRCDIIVLNAHAQSEDKGDDSKDRFHEELDYSRFSIIFISIIRKIYSEILVEN